MSGSSFRCIIVFVVTIQLCIDWTARPRIANADDAEWYYTRGRRLLIQGEYSGAIKALDRFELRWGDYSYKVHLFLGIAQARLGASRDIAYSSREYYNRALDEFEVLGLVEDPSFAKTAVGHHFKGLAQMGNRQYYRAAESFDNAISMYDCELFDKGLSGETVNTSTIFDFFDERERKLIPDFITTYIGWHTATALLAGYLAELDFDLIALINCKHGIVLGAFEQYATAIKVYNRAIKEEPDLALAYIGRGYVKSKLELHSDALLDFDKAIELAPNDALAYYLRGSAKYKLDQPKEATQDMQNALRLIEKHGQKSYRAGSRDHTHTKTSLLATFIEMTMDESKQTENSQRRTQIRTFQRD
jgi:tetratricopeptide (TPR) repeat protein